LVAVTVGTLVPGFPLVSRATADTWSGTWARTELPGKHLLLTQTGSTVSGHYDWNDASGHLSGQVHGATLSGGFNETHYQGTYSLTLGAGHCRNAAAPTRCFEGSAQVTNKDTGFMGSSAFDGTCVAGPCLQNGTATPPPPTVQVVSSPTGFDKTVQARAPHPGNGVTNDSPPLGAATSASADLSGLTPDEIAVVPYLVPGLKQHCFMNFLGGVLGESYTAAEPAADSPTGIAFKQKFIVESLPKALSQLAWCLAYVDSLAEAATHASSQSGDHPPAGAAAAACGAIDVTLTIHGHGSNAKAKASHRAPAGVHESCSITGGKLQIKLRSTSHKPLSQSLGSRLHLLVFRDRRATSAGPLSFRYHKG
jgi:hypothetical protein